MTGKMKKYISFFLIAITALVFSGCGSNSGDSYFNLPQAPKEIFRGGFGKITIKYKPPPEPIFKVQSATQYIDLKEITSKYKIPDRPYIIELNVKNAVLSSRIINDSGIIQFDRYIENACKGWMFTQWGTGRLRLQVNVRAETITVDPSEIMLKSAGPDRSPTKIGNPYDLVRASGFTVKMGKVRTN